METMEEKIDRNTILRTGMLQCSTSLDQETGLYIAHCLNFDLMESGKTPDEAWANLKASLKPQKGRFIPSNSAKMMSFFRP